MLYRRPLMGIFAVAQSVDASQVDGMHPKTVPLSRRVANELVIASVLAPLAVSDLGPLFDKKV